MRCRHFIAKVLRRAIDDLHTVYILYISVASGHLTELIFMLVRLG